MVYLIGGPPKCGKTTVAKLLSKKSGVPWVSGDTLQNIVQDVLPRRAMLKRFPYQRIKKTTGGSIDKLYELYPWRQIVASYHAAAKGTEKAIEAFVDDVISENHDYILEGLQIEPELVERLKKRYGTAIRAVFVVKTDPEKFLRDVKKSTTFNDWILKGAKQQSTLPKVARMICNYGADIKKRAERARIPVFCMDQNFSQVINDAIRYFLR